MKCTLRVFVVLALLCQLGFSQVDPWERINLIEKGKSVSIILVSGDTVSGKMDEWRLDGLVLRKGKIKTVTVARADAAKVYLVAGMSRGRRAGWAFGIGGAAGAGLYGAAVAAGGSDGVPAAALVIGGGIFIGGISAAIAALIPQHKELIYTAPMVAPPAAKK
jgi:hypothetical protein